MPGPALIPRMGIHQPEEILLSYLCGLAPVGQTFEIQRKLLMADLGLKHAAYYYRLLNRLFELKAVQRVSCGASQGTGVLVVLKRPEHVTFVSRVKQRHWRSEQRWADFRAGFNPAFRQQVGA